MAAADDDALNGNGFASRGAVARHLVDAFQIPAATAPVHFSDLPASHPFASDINTLVSLGIMSGDDGKTTVRPNDPINRAEFAKLVTTAINVLVRTGKYR